MPDFSSPLQWVQNKKPIMCKYPRHFTQCLLENKLLPSLQLLIYRKTQLRSIQLTASTLHISLQWFQIWKLPTFSHTLHQSQSSFFGSDTTSDSGTLQSDSFLCECIKLVFITLDFHPLSLLSDMTERMGLEIIQIYPIIWVYFPGLPRTTVQFHLSWV